MNQEIIKQINDILNDTLIKHLKQNDVSVKYTGEAVCVNYGEIIYNGETLPIFNDDISFHIKIHVFYDINKEVCNILARKLEQIKGDFKVTFDCYLRYISCEKNKFLGSWRTFDFVKSGNSCHYTSQIICPSLFISGL